jgi:hypothetical protein
VVREGTIASASVATAGIAVDGAGTAPAVAPAADAEGAAVEDEAEVAYIEHAPEGVPDPESDTPAAPAVTAMGTTQEEVRLKTSANATSTHKKTL